jgi:hypothetical protein
MPPSFCPIISYMDIVTLKEAREKGLVRYFTGKECKRGHISERFTSDRSCCACKGEDNHLERNKKARRKYAREHPEQMTEYCRTYEKRHKDKRAARRSDPKYQKYTRNYQIMRYANDSEFRNNRSETDKRSYRKHAEKRRAKSRRFARENRALIASYSAQRRASRLQATPPWANREAIQSIYEAAERINQTTGIKHNVDHSIALYATDDQNNHVACGLHCEANLAILTESDNLSKGTKLIEDLDTWLTTHSVTPKN